MRGVHPVAPFAVEPPAVGSFELAEEVPDFDGADCVAADEGESGEKVETEDFDPELTGGMFRVDVFRVWSLLITENKFEFDRTKARRIDEWQVK